MNFKNKKFPAQIFRAYDIRGKVSLLTPEIVKAIAYGLVAQYHKVGQTQLAIGYDARLTSPEYAEIIRKRIECDHHRLLFDAIIIFYCPSI